MATPAEAASRMLHAVNDLVVNHDSPPELTKEFWKALADFAPVFLNGDVNVVMQESTGHVVVTYKL